MRIFSNLRGRYRLRRRLAWALIDIMFGSWFIFISYSAVGATSPNQMRMKMSPHPPAGASAPGAMRVGKVSCLFRGHVASEFSNSRQTGLIVDNSFILT